MDEDRIEEDLPAELPVARSRRTKRRKVTAGKKSTTKKMKLRPEKPEANTQPNTSKQTALEMTEGSTASAAERRSTSQNQAVASSANSQSSNLSTANLNPEEAILLRSLLSKVKNSSTVEPSANKSIQDGSDGLKPVRNGLEDVEEEDGGVVDEGEEVDEREWETDKDGIDAHHNDDGSDDNALSDGERPIKINRSALASNKLALNTNTTNSTSTKVGQATRQSRDIIDSQQSSGSQVVVPQQRRDPHHTISVIPPENAGEFDDGVVNADEEDQESNANNPVIDVDNSIILTLFRSHKAEIMEFLNTFAKGVRDSLTKDTEALKSLKEEIVDLGSLVVTAAKAMVNKQITTSVKPKEVQRALCIVPCIFTDKVICTVMAKVLIGFCINEIKNGDDRRKGKLGSNLLEVMFFSKLRNEKKREKLASQLGQKYSSFRHGVLLSCIMAMQDNAFQTFLTKKERDTAKIISLDPGASDSTKLFSSKVIRPPWLAPGYISRLHCQKAAAKAESRGNEEAQKDKPDSESSVSRDTSQVSNRSEERGRNPNGSSRSKSQKPVQSLKDTIAVEAASLVYKSITNVLHKARDATKIQLFHEGLYVFTGWSQNNAKVRQSSLRLRWNQEDDRVTSTIDSFPVMNELHVLDRYNYCRLKADNVNERNLKVLRSFMKEHPEMFLVVEHDVLVNDSTRKLRYYINIIEMVAKLLASFTTVGTNGKTEDILNAHVDSLKVIIFMSIGMRSIIDRTMQDKNPDGTVKWIDFVTGAASSPASYSFPKVDGVSLENFHPPRSKQKEILVPLLLSLKEAEYAEKNSVVSSRAETIDEDPLFGSSREGDHIEANSAAIEADSSLSVFKFT